MSDKNLEERSKSVYYCISVAKLMLPILGDLHLYNYLDRLRNEKKRKSNGIFERLKNMYPDDYKYRVEDKEDKEDKHRNVASLAIVAALGTARIAVYARLFDYCCN